MRNLMYLFAGILLLAVACRKSVSSPRLITEYHSLNDQEVKYLHPFLLDMDGDTAFDVYFRVALEHDQEGDHAKFTAISVVPTKLLSKPDSVIKLIKGHAIPVIPAHPEEWNGSVLNFCEILLPAGHPEDTTWRGSWVAANRQYVGVQFMKGKEPYLGWVSISVDTARDCMILHECAWRKASAGTIHAGNTN